MAGSIFDFLSRWREKPAEAPVAAMQTPLADEAFLAFVSHELRTPLNAIIGYSEILQEDATFLEQKDFLPDLQKIQKASEHLLTLVDDVIDLSRLEAGRMDIALEEFRPADLVKDVVADTRALVARTLCTLEAECSPDVATMVADRAKAQRGLSNLVRHVTGLARQGTMRLEVARDPERADLIRFSLSHSDLVLRPKEVRALLEMGTRGKGGLPQYHGSGLGLVITERFCRLMGGDFLVSPTAEGGVVMTMRVPERVRAVANAASRV